ncbi:MAG: Glucoamylase [uncultured Gemmatimonadetes bacterium]|uniref:Glucoamylase n=1 Tax=uncultured Gemmatimonadota bacterium TaxID=203437 RepID=A0A6J4MRC0_9BACT|nr:MAG: Glucoamylase [uncultured Gemmatimonadota bacterium]
MPYPAIEDHGIIGDLNTVALVGLDGTIGFMCAPRLDSPTVFASLLDAEKGGAFEIAPMLEGARARQLYLPDTNVLLTRFMAPAGVAEITDFMPVGDSDVRRVVRRAKAVRGEITIRVRCAPRFGYGRTAHEATHGEECVVFTAADGSIKMRLDASVALEVIDGDAHAEFTLSAGEAAIFILEIGGDCKGAPRASRRYAARAFKDTENFWRRWIGRSTYTGRWRDEVNRSALALKLLVSDPHGSLLAAPTFGLPERIGGARNWDYRYTWVRDSAFTLYALIRLGLTEETGAFVHWIADRVTGDTGNGGPLQPLYMLDGETDVPEEELDHWEGYGGSRPVRVGNGAAEQLQLDIYGALMDSVYMYDKYGEPISHDLWVRLSGLVEWVVGNWRLPDHGIWEIRSEKREHLSSRLLCWVAVDRAVRLAMRRSFPAPLARWTEARDEIYNSIFDEMWNPKLGAFVGERGGTEMDASVLLMPLLRFISPTDPRWTSTMKAVTRDLVEDSLVRRYRIHGAETDGFADDEGTFTICSFWYAECLARAGDVQQARFVFEKVLGYANHLGLFAEQLGPSGEHLGNFPQAFTHLALISAAYDIDRRLSGEGWMA